MPIYEERYRRWQGSLSRRPLTWWVIARTGVPLQWKRLMRILIILASISFLAAAFMVYATMRAGSSAELAEIAANAGLSIDAEFFMQYLVGQNLWLAFVVVLAGSGLIADDRRLGAYPIYFARPVGFVDYLSGKLLVTGIYGGAITILPGVMLWVIAILLSQGTGFFSDWWWVPFAVIGQGLLMIGVYGTVTLALSAVSKAARPAAVLFFGLFFVPDLLRELAPSGSDLGLFSMQADLGQTAALLFGQKPPHEYSAWLALTVLVLYMAAAVAVILWRIRPSEVVK